MDNIVIYAKDYGVFDTLDVSIGPLTVVEGKSMSGKSRLCDLIGCIHDAVNRRKLIAEKVMYVGKEIGKIWTGPRTMRDNEITTSGVMAIATNDIIDTALYDIPGITREAVDGIRKAVMSVSGLDYAETTLRSAGFLSAGDMRIDYGFSSLIVTNGSVEMDVGIESFGELNVFMLDKRFMDHMRSPEQAAGDDVHLGSQYLRVMDIIDGVHRGVYESMARKELSECGHLAASELGTKYKTAERMMRFGMGVTGEIFKAGIGSDTLASRLSEGEAFVMLMELMLRNDAFDDKSLVIIDTPEAIADDEIVEDVLDKLYAVANRNESHILVVTRRHYNLPDGVARATAEVNNDFTVSISMEEVT